MKILLAIDESKFSKAALHALLTQFTPPGATVRVLTVIEPISTTPPPQMTPGFLPELSENVRAARELVERTAQMIRAAGFEVETAVDQGDAREKILDGSDQWGADLIVMGSHGKRGVQRFLLGSVADFVARHAQCSAEIVRSAPGF